MSLEIMEYFFYFSYSCIGVGVCMDISGHFRRTILRHLSSITLKTMANAEPRVQNDWLNMVL
jgi:hypothetical protein